MVLQDDVQAALTDAMKARDADRVSALRMAIAALKNAAVAANLGPQGRLDDEAAQRVLSAEVKRRREAAEAFRRAGHEDRAAAEEAEAAVYREYLPAELDDAELERLVDAAIAETGATDRSAMGAVMKSVMAAAGSRAEGGRVSAIVRRRLEG